MTSTTLGALGQLFDGPHATPTRQSEGPYFLNIASLNSGRLDLSLSDHVTPEDYSRWTRRVTPREGDLLFSYETRLGEAALMPANVQACLGRRMALLRPDTSRVDPQYLLYYYLSPDFQQQIQQRSIHGATVSRIGLSTMSDWPVSVPELGEQQGIAAVLTALDDKIAANGRTVGLLNSIATSEVARALTDVAELRHVGLVVMGSSPRGESMNEIGQGIEFFQGVRDFGPRVPTSRIHTTEPVRLASAGDVLLSVRAPVGKVNRADRPLCIGRGLAAITSTTETPYVLFHALRMAESAWQPFNSEGTVFGSINQTDLKRVTIPWSGTESVAALELELAALERRIDLAVGETRKLAELRDTLLPALMSGRVSVREAEATVGAAI